MKKGKLIIALFLFISTYGSAQTKGENLYLTENGKIFINGVLADTSVQLVSQNLYALLNYDDAKFTLKVDISSFSTGDHYIDSILKKTKSTTIDLSGKFDMNYINTVGHPPIDFLVDGLLSSSNKMINGNGRLEHLSDQSSFSCLLTLSFVLDKKDIGYDFSEVDLDNEIKVEIIQIVMKRLDGF